MQSQESEFGKKGRKRLPCAPVVVFWSATRSRPPGCRQRQPDANQSLMWKVGIFIGQSGGFLVGLPWFIPSSNFNHSWRPIGVLRLFIYYWVKVRGDLIIEIFLSSLYSKSIGNLDNWETSKHSPRSFLIKRNSIQLLEDKVKIRNSSIWR